jgi:acetoin utilization protein AcuB
VNGGVRDANALSDPTSGGCPACELLASDCVDRMPTTNSVMTPIPYVVQVDDSLLYAREVMVRHRIRHLPVKDGKTLAGVLSDRDLKRALDPDLGLPPKDELFVREVFEPEAYVVNSSEPLDNVLEHMATEHIGSALVIKDGHLVGIFTATDACRVFCRHLRSMFPKESGDAVA